MSDRAMIERVWDTVRRLSSISSHGATAWKIAKVCELQEEEVRQAIEALLGHELLKVTKVNGARYFMPRDGAPEVLPPHVSACAVPLHRDAEALEKEALEANADRPRGESKAARKTEPIACRHCGELKDPRGLRRHERACARDMRKEEAAPEEAARATVPEPGPPAEIPEVTSVSVTVSSAPDPLALLPRLIEELQRIPGIKVSMSVSIVLGVSQ